VLFFLERKRRRWWYKR